MKISERIQAFVDLGFLFNEISDPLYKHEFIDQVVKENNFFIKENISFSFKSLSNILTKKKIEKWLSFYDIDRGFHKTVLVICAGNIPLVAFHDILCVLILGNKLIIKPSSKDSILIHFVIKKLIEIQPKFSNLISFAKINNYCDVVICTGNNVSATYFKYHFKETPSIIRSSRTSIAILSGDEDEKELRNLCDDIFTYFGLGCRNVTKIYIPKSYDFNILKAYFQEYISNLNCKSYLDNYIYNKALLSFKKKYFKDFGSILLVESKHTHPPISVLFFEYYNTLEEITFNSDSIQCIVSNVYRKSKTIPFGSAQKPELLDYADNLDTISFLLKQS